MTFTDPAGSVLEAIERRLLAQDAYEALWHLGRLCDTELRLLVEREVRSQNHERVCGGSTANLRLVVA